MASYEWVIEKLYTKNITTGGTTYTDVIKRVEAHLKATSDVKSSLTRQHYVDLNLNTNNVASSFTAYNGVSKANVISWVETRLTSSTINSIKTHLENELAFDEDVDGAAAKVDSDGNATFPYSQYL